MTLLVASVILGVNFFSLNNPTSDSRTGALPISEVNFANNAGVGCVTLINSGDTLGKNVRCAPHSGGSSDIKRTQWPQQIPTRVTDSSRDVITV